MSVAARGIRRFGEGPLSQGAAFVYNLLVIELLFALAILPGAVPLVLLARDASNVPLAAVCALPLGPALSAAVYALHHRSADATDLHPAAAFWRGYRANLRPVLIVWAPLLAWLSILGLNLANFGAADVPDWWAVLLVLVAVAATLWGANALVITSLFTFRAGDIAKLAAYFLVRTPGVTLGNVCLLIVATGVIVLGSEAILALLGSVFALAFLRNSRPMIIRVKEEFTS
jgi:hypothetical protein